MCLHACLCVRMFVCSCLCMYVNVYVVCVWTYMHVLMYVCVYACMWMCVWLTSFHWPRCHSEWNSITAILECTISEWDHSKHRQVAFLDTTRKLSTGAGLTENKITAALLFMTCCSGERFERVSVSMKTSQFYLKIILFLKWV